MTMPPVPAMPSPDLPASYSGTAMSNLNKAWISRDAARLAREDQLLAEIDRLKALLDSQTPVPVPDSKPFVRLVNWWCADGFREGQPVLHHLDETGPGAPEVAAYRALVQQKAGTVYSWDISSLGGDANIQDTTKIESHKQMFGVPNIKHVRVFFGTAAPVWTNSRIAALKPGDTFLLSSMSTDWAAWKRFFDSTPDKFRNGLEPLVAFGHEREANLDVSTTLKPWLDNNARLADALNAAEGYETDQLVKIGLYYSQEIENVAATPNREQLYGGQDFGIFGEDVYNPRALAGYRTADQLVGPIIRFCQDIGRPCAIPELGAERKASDPTGAGRAKMITDIGAYIAAANASVAAA